MAYKEDYARWIVDHQDLKGTPEFEKVAQAYKVARSASDDMDRTLPGGTVIKGGKTVYDAENDPTNNLSPVAGIRAGERYAAGIGGGIADLALGASQLVPGLPPEWRPGGSAAEKSKLDAPLKNTTAGKAGFVTAYTLPALAASAAPGANTIGGAGGIGALLGALEPADSASQRLTNMAQGGAWGAGGQALGYGLGKIATGGANLIRPLTARGQGEAADLVLQQAAQDPAKAAQAALQYKAATPGVNPTLSQSSLDPGLAALEMSRGTFGGADIATQRSANRQALVDALKGIAGNDADYQALVSARSAAVEPAYDFAKAQRAQISPRDALNIFGRPAIQDALRGAAKIEANAGRPSNWLEEITPGSLLTGQQAHTVKMKLDAGLEPNPMSGIDKADAAGMKDARDAFLGWLEREIPDYKVARTTHAWMSPEINQRDVGKLLLEKIRPALVSNEDTVVRLTPDAYAKALQDADAMVRKATGFDGSTLENTMNPAQIRTIYGVRDDLGREATARDLGAAYGSPTKQNTDYQTLADDAAGLLKNRSLLARALMGVMNAPGKYTQGAVDREITRRLLDPREGAAALTRLPSPRKSEELAQMLRAISTPGALSIYSSQQ